MRKNGLHGNGSHGILATEITHGWWTTRTACTAKEFDYFLRKKGNKMEQQDDMLLKWVVENDYTFKKATRHNLRRCSMQRENILLTTSCLILCGTPTDTNQAIYLTRWNTLLPLSQTKHELKLLTKKAFRKTTTTATDYPNPDYAWTRNNYAATRTRSDILWLW